MNVLGAAVSTRRKVPHHDIDLASAKLRAVTLGELHEVLLGASERTKIAPLFTPEESDFVMSFESVGDNCEFGLMQRAVGCERMGLLRYAGVGDIMKLVGLLQTRFEGFCEEGDLAISTFGAEWIADVVSATMNMHTGRIQSLASREQIEAEERVKLQFLANKMMDDLEQGEKTSVYRTLVGSRGGPDGTYGMDQLYDAMRSYGECALLWVNEADVQHPHGTVRHVRGSLYRGYIRKLRGYENAHAADERAWIDLLARARTSIQTKVAAVRREDALV